MSTGVTPIVGAVVGAAAFTFFAGNPGGGFMIYVIAPFLLVWLLYTVYVFWRRPQRRRTIWSRRQSPSVARRPGDAA